MAYENSVAETRGFVRRRGAIKAKLTMFDRFLESHEQTDNVDIATVQHRIAQLEKEFEPFEKIQGGLEMVCSDDEFEQRIEERIEIESCYHDSVSRARALISAKGRRGVAGSAEIAQVRSNTIGPTDIVSDGQSRQPIANADRVLASQSPTSFGAEAQIKLPTMPLPKFGGSCAAWPGFCDAFRAAVHENAAFRDTQKLIYLKSCLTGRAAEKIESLETTAANYSVAWGILEKNYDDPKAIINSRIQAFFELPHCVRANTQSFSDLVDQVTKHYRALEALRTPFLEAFPIYAITSRLDEQSRLRWKEETQGSALPTMEQLLGFLHNRQKLLDSETPERSHRGAAYTGTRSEFRAKYPTRANQASTLAHAVTAAWCQICRERHFTTACPKLSNAQIEQRMEMVRRAKLCTKCLQPNHFARHCAAGGCRQCRGNHHTLLHPSQAMEQQTAVQANVSTLYVSVRPETLLATAVIHVLDNRGQPRPVRVLLDSGSQSHFLTEAIARKLGLARRRIEVPVVGINQTSTGVTSSTTARIQSRINGFQADINCLIIPRITEKLPSRVIGRTAIKIPGNITLADPNFNTPSEIEGLIGAEWFLRLLCVGQISLENGAVTLQKTKFGWVLGGKLWGSVAAGSSRCNLTREALQQQMGKIWELKETPEKTPVSAEERACGAHCLSNARGKRRQVKQVPSFKDDEESMTTFSRDDKVVLYGARSNRELRKKFIIYEEIKNSIGKKTKRMGDEVQKPVRVANAEAKRMEDGLQRPRPVRVVNAETNRMEDELQRPRPVHVVNAETNRMEDGLQRTVRVGNAETKRMEDEMQRPLRVVNAETNRMEDELQRPTKRMEDEMRRPVSVVNAETKRMEDEMRRPLRVVNAETKRMEDELQRPVHAVNVETKRCFGCGLPNQVSANCPMKGKGVKCIKCNEHGHVASECPRKPNMERKVHSVAQFPPGQHHEEVKVYIALFVCFATKAAHIGIASDLAAQAFLAALRRFFSRGGRLGKKYGDNGRNFVGVRREVKELFAFIESQARNEAIAVELAGENISRDLIPPRAPHFGGLWGAAARAAKHHLVRVIGEALLFYGALLTYVIQIGAILNSRPITTLSPDPNDLQALTPAHFLIGGTLTSIPEYDYSEIPLGRLSSWAHIPQMRRHFWNRWSKECLQEQTIRKRWHSGMAQNIRVGSLVIVREDHTPPLIWPLGRFIAIHPGEDGVARVVTARTAYGEYKRCAKRIAPLPLDS
ncbi:uncharacterized protein LOC143154660 [Ptiloglossa arizonensis]|uniref:uncharacterized protein LOC143154660 n=1 Tax=Ptiloglossa arizonensis TaxID=3350558 RepID=UPI003FA015E4